MCASTLAGEIFCRTKSVLVKPTFCVLTAGYSKKSSRRTPSDPLTWIATPLHPSAVDHCCSRCKCQVRRKPSMINADSIERLARGIADPVSHSERADCLPRSGLCFNTTWASAQAEAQSNLPDVRATWLPQGDTAAE